jgi:hypothetical protein
VALKDWFVLLLVVPTSDAPQALALYAVPLQVKAAIYIHPYAYDGKQLATHNCADAALPAKIITASAISADRSFPCRIPVKTFIKTPD